MLREVVTRAERLFFDNQRFWDDRYRTNPTKGSGPGSRGTFLADKRQLIETCRDEHGLSSVIDLGCGDIEVVRELDIGAYYGIDVSQVVIERNRTIRPDWKFECADITGITVHRPYDLTLCVDVLIHQRQFRHYEGIVRKLHEIDSPVILVSGYSRKPDSGAWNVFFHEPLADTLTRIMPHRSFKVVYNYRDTDLFISVPKA